MVPINIVHNYNLFTCFRRTVSFKFKIVVACIAFICNMITELVLLKGVHIGLYRVRHLTFFSTSVYFVNGNT